MVAEVAVEKEVVEEVTVHLVEAAKEEPLASHLAAAVVEVVAVVEVDVVVVAACIKMDYVIKWSFWLKMPVNTWMDDISGTSCTPIQSRPSTNTIITQQKGWWYTKMESSIMLGQIKRQLPFLQGVSKDVDVQTRRKRFEAANADEINAVSELIVNVLRQRVPVSSCTLQRFHPHRQALRDMGHPKLSIKKRRQVMMQQSESGVWSGVRPVSPTFSAEKSVKKHVLRELKS